MAFGEEPSLPQVSSTGSWLTSLFGTIGLVGSEYLKLEQAKALAEAQMKVAKMGQASLLPGAVSPGTPAIQPGATSDLSKYILIGGIGLAAVMLLSSAAKGRAVKK